MAWSARSAASSLSTRSVSRAHAGQGFVEQQHPGSRREAHRDFELTLLAVRQRSPIRAAQGGQPGLFEYAVRRFVGPGASGLPAAASARTARWLAWAARRAVPAAARGWGRSWCAGSCGPRRRGPAAVASSARRARSFIAISPPLGGSSPDSTLTSVDLPAPLVPITAWMRPGERSMQTSCRACRPPKWRETLRAEKRAGALMAGACSVRRNRARAQEVSRAVRICRRSPPAPWASGRPAR
ncbi:hypothetical protein CDEF62S_00175 [Castellaniella defragrans]